MLIQRSQPRSYANGRLMANRLFENLFGNRSTDTQLYLKTQVAGRFGQIAIGVFNVTTVSLR